MNYSQDFPYDPSNDPSLLERLAAYVDSSPKATPEMAVPANYMEGDLINYRPTLPADLNISLPEVPAEAIPNASAGASPMVSKPQAPARAPASPGPEAVGTSPAGASAPDPLKDPYGYTMRQLGDNKKAAETEINDRLARYEEYQKTADELRKSGETPPWLDLIVNLGTAALRGYGQMQQKTTPGMVAAGVQAINPASGVDELVKQRGQQRAERDVKLQQRLQSMRDYLEMRNGIGDARLRLGDMDLRAGELGIQKQNRDQDVAFRDKQLSAENSRHAQSMALQREKMAQDERLANAKTRNEAFKMVQEVAGKHGEKSAENLAQTLDKMEGDEIYRNANKMMNSAGNVKALLDTPGGFAEIGALIQALRAMGDSGVISDSDMKRNIAGSLSAVDAWLAPYKASLNGGLPADAKANIGKAMDAIIGNVKTVIDERRSTYRDAYDRSENMRLDAARKVYGNIPMTRPTGKELDTVFNIGRFTEAPKKSQGNASPELPYDPSKVDARRVIGGKNYVRSGGNWFEEGK